MIKKLLKNLGMFLVALVLFAATSNFSFVHAASKLETGNFMTAFNNTTQEGAWRDPVSAKPGDVIEYKITIKNVGDQPAPDVQVWGSVNGQVPQDPAKQLVITGKINNPAEPSSVTDTATVNITGDMPVGMRYYPGHARINAVTDKYNCPNVCDIPDAGVLGGLTVGTIQPGDFVTLTFKAALSAAPAVSASPAPSVAPSASPAPSGSPTPNQNIQCPSGTTFQKIEGNNIICINNNNVNNNTNNNTQNQTVNVGGSTVTVVSPSSSPAVVVASNVKELPNTGLPLAGLALAGLTPVGLKLKRFGKGAKDALTPNFMWEQREFNKDLPDASV